MSYRLQPNVLHGFLTLTKILFLLLKKEKSGFIINTVNTVMTLNNSSPIFIQIKDYYISLINKGILKEDDALPSVREVALFFKVNPNTVQRAFTLLVDEGYVQNIPKKGFFVHVNVDADKKEHIKQVLKELYALGITEEEIKEIMEELKDDRN